MIIQYSQGILQSIYNLTCLSHPIDPPECEANPAPDSCDHSMDLGVRCLTYQEVCVSIHDESETTEVLKRDSTNLMTSDKILGALTGLLTAALLVVTMGWIASCVCLVRKFKQRWEFIIASYTPIQTPTRWLLKPIDNHGSGYLGMARCFNVNGWIPAQLKQSYLGSEKALAENNYTSKKSNLQSLYKSIFIC